MSYAELYYRSVEHGLVLLLALCVLLLAGDWLAGWWERRRRERYQDPECWCPWRERGGRE